MDEIRVELEGMLKTCERTHTFYSKELEQYPEGQLYRTNRNGSNNYFWAEKEDDRYIRRGITRNEFQIHQLARKRYIEEIDKHIINNISVIDMAIKQLKPVDGDSILDKMPTAYRELPESFFLTRPIDLRASQSTGIRASQLSDSDASLADKGAVQSQAVQPQKGYHKIASGIYVPDSLREAAIQGTLSNSQREQIREIQREWANQDYPKNTKNLEQKKIITSQGLKVRSMAEGSITESIYEHDIPFRHDQLVTIGKQTVSPDFSFLSIVRGEIYWEHCGLTNSQKYIDYQRYKRGLYESIGVVPWKNFIVTFNEENGFFDTREIEAIITNKLMRWLYLD